MKNRTTDDKRRDRQKMKETTLACKGNRSMKNKMTEKDRRQMKMKNRMTDDKEEINRRQRRLPWHARETA